MARTLRFMFAFQRRYSRMYLYQTPDCGPTLLNYLLLILNNRRSWLEQGPTLYGVCCSALIQSCVSVLCFKIQRVSVALKCLVETATAKTSESAEKVMEKEKCWRHLTQASLWLGKDATGSKMCLDICRRWGSFLRGVSTGVKRKCKALERLTAVAGSCSILRESCETEQVPQVQELKWELALLPCTEAK